MGANVSSNVMGATTPRGMRNNVAVSYTHLRAHETVLDLVCRLLLEKKKKHNQQRTYCAITHSNQDSLYNIDKITR